MRGQASFPEISFGFFTQNPPEREPHEPIHSIQLVHKDGNRAARLYTSRAAICQQVRCARSQAQGSNASFDRCENCAELSRSCETHHPRYCRHMVIHLEWSYPFPTEACVSCLGFFPRASRSSGVPRVAPMTPRPLRRHHVWKVACLRLARSHENRLEIFRSEFRTYRSTISIERFLSFFGVSVSGCFPPHATACAAEAGFRSKQTVVPSSYGQPFHCIYSITRMRREAYRPISFIKLVRILHRQNRTW